jgi:hypothetical protein
MSLTVVLRDVDAVGEASTAEDLPVASRLQHRRVLQRIGKARLVRPQIHFFVVGAVGVDAEIETEEAASGRSRHVHVEDAIAHLEILEDGCAAIEQQTLPAVRLCDPCLSLQIPARRVGRNGQTWRLRVSRRRDDSSEGARRQGSQHGATR